MSVTEFAQMSVEDGGRVSLGTDERSGETLLVFDGPDGLETTIRFSELTIGRSKIVFYGRSRGRLNRRYRTGMVEAQRDIADFLTYASDEHEQLRYDVVVDR